MVLGFRGFYADSDSGYKASIISAHRLPDTIESWCRSTARSLQLRQGRPEIPEAVQAGGSAKPLSGRTSLTIFSMISVVLFGLAIATALIVFDVFSVTT